MNVTVSLEDVQVKPATTVGPVPMVRVIFPNGYAIVVPADSVREV